MPGEENHDPFPRALDEMFLLHHFTATTYAVLDVCTNSETQRIWQHNVVRIGLQHPFLLRGILAVSAAHLAYLSPNTKSKYLLQSSAHVDVALMEFRRQLLCMEESHVLPLFPLASLLVVQSLAAVNLQNTPDHIGAFLSCVHLVKGVSTVLYARWHVFEHCELSPLISAATMQQKDVDISEFALLYNAVRDRMQEDAETDKSACLTAISDLQSVFRCQQDHPQDKSGLAILLTWPLKLHPRFVEMLSERHPMALIILAHMVVILQSVNQVWWLSGWGARLLEAITGHLKDEFRMWLMWPMDCIRSERDSGAIF